MPPGRSDRERDEDGEVGEGGEADGIFVAGEGELLERGNDALEEGLEARMLGLVGEAETGVGGMGECEELRCAH